MCIKFFSSLVFKKRESSLEERNVKVKEVNAAQSNLKWRSDPELQTGKQSRTIANEFRKIEISKSTPYKDNSGCCRRAVLDLKTIIECVLFRLSYFPQVEGQI